jgi:DNA-binding winged helix-turn-helix (wHTH) protein
MQAPDTPIKYRMAYTSEQIQAIKEEAYQQGVNDTSLAYVQTGGLTINLKTGDTYVHDRPLYLRPAEERLLLVLAQNLGQKVPEEVLSQALLNLPNRAAVLRLARISRGRYIKTVCSRINLKIQALGLPRMISPGSFQSLSRDLIQLPPETGEEENDTPEGELPMGYSRAQVRHMLTASLENLQHGNTAQAEALLVAAIDGLPTALESSAMGIGRPNRDDRIIEALKYLGADERFVTLRELSHHLKLTTQFLSQALHRMRTRQPYVRYVPRLGYSLGANVHVTPGQQAREEEARLQMLRRNGDAHEEERPEREHARNGNDANEDLHHGSQQGS